MTTITPSLFCAGHLSSAKILMVGHDRRLQRSQTMADAPFFADYFLRPIPTQRSELAKYKLAEALFAYVGAMTSYAFPASSVAITNLCNSPLPHSPAGKIVLIPREEAQAGIEHLRDIVRQASIHLIFAMSEQVNYWIQELRFSTPNNKFLRHAAPRQKGIDSDPPYYEPSKPGAFRLICGTRLASSEGVSLYPVVHVKNWPLDARFARAYGTSYARMISELKRLEGGA